MGILGGSVPPGCQNPDPISGQTNVIFHTYFQTRPLKPIPVFRPGLSNPFRIRIFHFLSYSFGIKTINTFIHSRSSLENHTRFQTKMFNVYTRGGNNYMAYIREYPLPRANDSRRCKNNCRQFVISLERQT